MQNKREAIMADLGWCLARVRKTMNGWDLTIVSPDDQSDSVFMPAQSIMIRGDGNIMALKKLLDQYDEMVKEDRRK